MTVQLFHESGVAPTTTTSTANNKARSVAGFLRYAEQPPRRSRPTLRATAHRRAGFNAPYAGWFLLFTAIT